MAPYAMTPPGALTPTTERDAMLNSNAEPVLNAVVNGEARSLPNAVSNGVSNGHINGNGSVMPNGNGVSNGDASSNGTTGSVPQPVPAVPYESAYTHGYTDGFTGGVIKAHIDLRHQPIAIIGMACRFPGKSSIAFAYFLENFEVAERV
jgi:hypothetical protein